MNKKKEEKRYIMKDFVNRQDDKYCVIGTKEELTRYFLNTFDDSLSTHEIITPLDLKGKKGHLYYVDYFRGDFSGSGGGSSATLVTLKEVEDWICTRVKEWHIGNGEVKFCVYPVYQVNPVDKMDRQEKIDKITRDIFKKKKKESKK